MVECPLNCNCVKCCAERHNRRLGKASVKSQHAPPKNLLVPFALGCCLAFSTIGFGSQYKIVAMASLGIVQGRMICRLGPSLRPFLTRATRNDFISMDTWPNEGVIGARITAVYQLSYFLSGQFIKFANPQQQNHDQQVEIVIVMIRNQVFSEPLCRHALTVSLANGRRFDSARNLHAVLNKGDQIRIMVIAKTEIHICLQDYDWNALLLKKL